MAAKSVLGWEPFTRRFRGRFSGRKISEYQGERLRTLFERLARICRRETRNWIEVCLEKVVNDTWNEKNAFFCLTDCSHKKVGPVIPFMIERNALSKTWQLHDQLTAGSEILPPPQADISVISTLVTNYNHAWSQGNYNFYLGQISFVFYGIYQSISWRLHTENVYLGKVNLVPR